MLNGVYKTELFAQPRIQNEIVYLAGDTVTYGEVDVMLECYILLFFGILLICANIPPLQIATLLELLTPRLERILRRVSS